MFVIEPSLAFLSGSEMLLVLVIALLVFGPKKLPQLARTLGEGMREFKKASSGIMAELSDQADPVSLSRAQPVEPKQTAPSLNGESEALPTLAEARRT